MKILISQSSAKDPKQQALKEKKAAAYAELKSANSEYAKAERALKAAQKVVQKAEKALDKIEKSLDKNKQSNVKLPVKGKAYSVSQYRPAAKDAKNAWLDKGIVVITDVTDTKIMVRYPMQNIETSFRVSEVGKSIKFTAANAKIVKEPVDTGIKFLVNTSEKGKTSGYKTMVNTLNAARKIGSALTESGTIYAVEGNKKTRIMIYDSKDPITNKPVRGKGWFFVSEKVKQKYS